jgi:hypothetical protein
MGFDLQMVRAPAAADEEELPNSGGVAGYYRFDLREMQVTVGALERAEALHDGPAPEIPELACEGLDEERVFAAIEALRGEAGAGAAAPTEAELAAARAFIAAHEAAMSASSIVGDRVGAFKFETNDGWLVTPEECRLLARKLRARCEALAREYFPAAGVQEAAARRWIVGFARYNEIAAEHGGYRVY